MLPFIYMHVLPNFISLILSVPLMLVILEHQTDEASLISVYLPPDRGGLEAPNLHWCNWGV